MKNIIKILTITLFLSIIVLSNFRVSAADSIGSKAEERLNNAIVLHIDDMMAFVNNHKVYIDPDYMVKPFIKDERTMVPVRFVSENLGAKVDWNGQTSTASITLNNKTVQMTIGSNIIKINGTNKAIDASPLISNERTFIPLRALVEALDKKVFWYNSGIIIISDIDNILDSERDKDIIKLIEEDYLYEESEDSWCPDQYVGNYNGWIYFINSQDNRKIYKVKEDGTKKSKVMDDQIGFGYIEVKNGYMYYESDYTDNYRLYRINIKTNQKDLIYEQQTSNIVWVDDWMYFSSNQNIYKCKFDGSERTIVVQDTGYTFAYFTIKDNWIYYPIYEQYYMMMLNGTNKVKISDTYIGCYGNKGNKIYYINYNDSSKLYKVSMDGINRNKLVNFAVDDICGITDQWIYFKAQSLGHNLNLYKVKPDGSELTNVSYDVNYNVKVIDDKVYYSNDSSTFTILDTVTDNVTNLNIKQTLFEVVGDWIYYSGTDNNGSLCKLKSDGTGKVILNK